MTDPLALENLPRYPGAGAPPEASRLMDSVPAGEPTTLGLVELLLKNPAAVDRLNREPARQAELFPRFLLIALASYVVYALMMVAIINLAPAEAYPTSLELPLPSAAWIGGAPWALPLAYTVGLVLAACVCLPSFYFYSLLSGVRMTWLQIVSVIGKGMASNAVLLLGLVPIYVIAALGGIIFAVEVEAMRLTLALGLVLPFLGGLWGLRAIILGLLDLTSALPAEWQCRRRCFLRRLVVSWTAVYAAVVPVMVYRLWEYFAGI